MKRNLKLSESYHLLHPKLTILVATKLNERQNVMTAAWAMPICDDPPIVGIALGKDSFTSEILRTTKEFTINIPEVGLKRAVLICGTQSGRKVDKAKMAGLTYAKAKNVGAPIIKECVGHLECRIREVVDGDGCWLFVADVLAAYAEEQFIKGGMWTEQAKLLLHFGKNTFGIPEIIRE